MEYRDDIDGLRALAVLAVVFHHLGIGLHGGYIGVDVFFVISGFLISKIILREVAEGRFTYARFYERRFVRIAPALLAVLTVTSAVAYVCLLPAEFISYAKSLFAAIFSFSNFFFFWESGYFSAAAQTKPLLHTWSLSVEEQFYVLFPILVMVVSKRAPQHLQRAVLGFGLLSFVLSVGLVLTNQQAAFYLPFGRAWELLLGTMVAMGYFPKLANPVLRNGATLLGLAILVGCARYYNAGTPFPGHMALLPCLGAVLIIGAGGCGPTLVSRLLSWKPVVFVGLISYSLYLWHWPVIVFGKMVSPWSANTTIAVELAVSLVLGWLSWKYVEQPFRHKQRSPLVQGVLFRALPALAVGLCILGVGLVTLQGLPGRFPPAAVVAADYLKGDTSHFRDGSCFISSAYNYGDYQPEKCLHRDNKPTALLLGDSHAADLWHGLALALKDDNVLQATASGCKPLIRKQPLREDARCTQLVTFILQDYLARHPVDQLILSARWTAADLPAVADTLAWAHERQIKVLLIGPAVEYQVALPRLLAISLKDNNPAMIDRYLVDQSALDGAMQEAATRTGSGYVSFYKMLCHGRSCEKTDPGGVPLQFDYGHLTAAGSAYVAQKMLAQGKLITSTPVPTPAPVSTGLL